MLTDKTKKYYGELLVGRLSMLLAEADNVVSGISRLKHESHDPLDQASLETDRNFTVRIKQKEGKLIREIEHALKRLKEGTFGLCQECGEEVSEKRLRAHPMTALCIQCQREQETKERVRGL